MELPMTILLPMYVHPLEDPDAWATLAGHASTVTVIVNVHDGPGENPDLSYELVTERLRSAGVDMIGYVDLRYGTRPCRDVWGDIVGWQRYPVSGLFFDRVPADAPGLDGVARAVQAAGCPVVLNPGTRPHPDYAGLAGTVCTFEGPWSAYRSTVLQPAVPEPDWPTAAHLVYGVPRSALDEATALLRRRVKTGLVTDLDAPTPYRGLPAGLRDGLRGGRRAVRESV
jgi:Spherulation-specific family 4